MIDSFFHIRLNGIKYRIAGDAEGAGYDKRLSPLLIQTGQAVQGETGKSKLRPDILSWSITDWTGGEGLLKFNAEEANRYWLSHNVDVLKEPGKLQLAQGYEETTDQLDATLTESFAFTKGRSVLHGFNLDANGVRTWDENNLRWLGSTTNGEGGFGGGKWQDATPTGDFAKVYMKEDGASSLWSWDGTTFVEHTTTLLNNNMDMTTVGLGDYLYTAGFSTGARVTEVSKTATPPVQSTIILDINSQGSDGGTLGGIGTLVAGDNRLYHMQTNVDETVIWKITPTTANGTGFSEEILRLKGITGTAIWHHMGVIFIGGRIGFDGDARQQVVMYVRGGEVGVLGVIRDGVSTGGRLYAGPESQSFDKAHFVAKYGPGDNTHEWTLFTVDLVSGSISASTVFDVSEDKLITGLITHNGYVFLSKESGAATKRVYRSFKSTYVAANSVTSHLITSVNDFGLKEEKILLSVRVECQPLNTGDIYTLHYQINQSGSWVSIGSDGTDNSTGTTFVISTDTTTVKFRNLQLRITLDNSGTTSSSPIILGVETFATVAKGILEFPMLLELYDDTSEAGGESTTGAAKVANIVTAGATGNVMQLDDGYGSTEANVFNAHDVVLVTYQLSLTRPGEGTAQVLLREVT